ncbi:capsid cement protein [Rhodospirillum centenum]|uniref:DUF2190 domain-containing protein n=1 Tax=Rhodospirillum centenum (strain ATCC 51521 / SW) TaxID=414684 RepID=B6IMF3_RHOCS|nr:capsid cement protein [Rhodospirillum centenum]ACI98532.1 phage-related conserved hypothetical protein [Rhodospirillum centenum SW]
MSNPGLIKAFKAGAAIAARRVVKFEADGDVVQAAAATDAVIGVSDLGAAAAGDTVDVILSDTAAVEYGGPVTFGAPLTADADGKAVVASPAAGANNWIIGQAMVDGVAGDIGLVHIAKSQMQG